MRALFLIGGTAAFLALAACASMPTAPPNAAPRLSFAQMAGQPNVPFSSVIQVAGPAVAADGPVARDAALLRIPYRYRHTAVLTEDVVGYSITVPGVQAPAGAPGYYAGTFRSGGAHGGGLPAELWCFLPQVVGGRRDNICLLGNQPGIAAIAPTRMNPYLWTGFAPATGSFDYVRTPVFEHRAVDIPGELVLEYRFRGWTRSGLRIEFLAVGREVETRELPGPAGAAVRLQTIGGIFDVSPDPNDPERAVVRRVE